MNNLVQWSHKDAGIFPRDSQLMPYALNMAQEQLVDVNHEDYGDWMLELRDEIAQLFSLPMLEDASDYDKDLDVRNLYFRRLHNVISTRATQLIENEYYRDELVKIWRDNNE